MAGVAQRNKIPGLASLLGTRKTRFQQNSTLKKLLIAAELAYKFIVIYLD
jgi:hypothetical protein